MNDLDWQNHRGACRKSSIWPTLEPPALRALERAAAAGATTGGAAKTVFGDRNRVAFWISLEQLPQMSPWAPGRRRRQTKLLVEIAIK